MKLRGKASLPHALFWSALGLILAMGWFLHAAAVKARTSSAAVVQSHEILQVLSEVEAAAARAERAHREYLASAADKFLIERDEAFTALNGAVTRLGAAVSGNRAQSENVRNLQTAVFEGAGILTRMADRQPSNDGGSEGSHVRTQQVANRINHLTSTIVMEERKELQERRRQQQNSFDTTTILLKIAFALAVLGALPCYVAFMWLRHSRRKLEQKLYDLAESIPGTVYQYRVRQGETPRFEILSRGVESMTGIGRRTILRDPSSLWSAIHEDDRQAFFDAIEKGFESLSPIEQDFRVRLASGELKWLRSFAAPRQERDGSVVWSGYWADVTRQKRLENELKDAKETADLATRAKSAFLAVMSHEIRTPMNGVLGMLELMSLTNLDREQRSTLSVVRESGRSLQRIIDDILDFSKIEAGKLEIAPETASLRAVIDSVRNIYIGNASSKGLLLVCRVDPAISPALEFDPMRLRQIVNNLTSNAIKFTSRGEVTLAAELKERRDGIDTVQISVTDTGVGIPQEAQERLFQPFAQASGTTARSFGGTGLGLTICKRLVDMMGGSISMSSEPGKGTRMEVVLSLPIADAKDLPAVSVSTAAATAGIEVKRTAQSVSDAERTGTLILVADDHSTNRLLLSRQLHVLGYASETAENGREALAKWSTGRFGAVITDVNMPELDGYGLARGIREAELEKGIARTPVIACTANAMRGDAEACLAAGMDDYLSKPVQLSELSPKLDQWVPLPKDGEPAARSGLQGSPLADAAAPPVVDRAALAEISGGVEAMEREILEDFARATVGDAAALRRAAADEDAAEIGSVAHRMKGAAKMVGARNLAAVCERIERAGKANDLASARAEMNTFERELTRLHAYVDSLTSAQQDGTEKGRHKGEHHATA